MNNSLLGLFERVTVALSHMTLCVPVLTCGGGGGGGGGPQGPHLSDSQDWIRIRFLCVT